MSNPQLYPDNTSQDQQGSPDRPPMRRTSGVPNLSYQPPQFGQYADDVSTGMPPQFNQYPDNVPTGNQNPSPNPISNLQTQPVRRASNNPNYAMPNPQQFQTNPSPSHLRPANNQYQPQQYQPQQYQPQQYQPQQYQPQQYQPQPSPQLNQPPQFQPSPNQYPDDISTAQRPTDPGLNQPPRRPSQPNPNAVPSHNPHNTNFTRGSSDRMNAPQPIQQQPSPNANPQPQLNQYPDDVSTAQPSAYQPIQPRNADRVQSSSERLPGDVSSPRQDILQTAPLVRRSAMTGMMASHPEYATNPAPQRPNSAPHFNPQQPLQPLGENAPQRPNSGTPTLPLATSSDSHFNPVQPQRPNSNAPITNHQPTAQTVQSSLPVQPSMLYPDDASTTTAQSDSAVTNPPTNAAPTGLTSSGELPRDAQTNQASPTATNGPKSPTAIKLTVLPPDGVKKRHSDPNVLSSSDPGTTGPSLAGTSTNPNRRVVQVVTSTNPNRHSASPHKTQPRAVPLQPGGVVVRKVSDETGTNPRSSQGPSEPRVQDPNNKSGTGSNPRTLPNTKPGHHGSPRTNARKEDGHGTNERVAVPSSINLDEPLSVDIPPLSLAASQAERDAVMTTSKSHKNNLPSFLDVDSSFIEQDPDTSPRALENIKSFFKQRDEYQLLDGGEALHVHASHHAHDGEIVSEKKSMHTPDLKRASQRANRRSQGRMSSRRNAPQGGGGGGDQALLTAPMSPRARKLSYGTHNFRSLHTNRKGSQSKESLTVDTTVVTATTNKAEEPVLPTSPRMLKSVLLTLGFIKANIIGLPDARAKLNKLKSTVTLFLKVEKKMSRVKGRILQAIQLRAAADVPNENVLRPSFLSNDAPTFFDFDLDRESKISISVCEDGQFNEALLGEVEFTFEEVLQHGKGEHWLPLKFEKYSCAGEILVKFNTTIDGGGEIKSKKEKTQWDPDSLIEGCVSTSIELSDDSEPGDNHATLVRLEELSIATQAVLYIPTFSDYVWNTDMFEIFNEESFTFYGLDLRRYGRSLHVEQGQHPNYCEDICEYYEEIGKALKIIHADGIKKVLLFGHGSGGVIAAHYASDHPEDIDGLLVTSPLVHFHSNLPGFELPWLNLSKTTQTSAVCFPYHQCLNSNFFGDYEWNQKLKPIEGFPLYSGWIEAFTLAFERGKNGLNVQCPLLCLSSDKSRIATRYMPELANEDALVSVKEIETIVPTWSRKAKIVKLPRACHDVLLSDLKVQDMAYDEIFNFFSYFHDL